MKRREFLRKGLALGAAGLLPNIGLSASGWLPPVSEATSSEPIWQAAVNGHWNTVKQWLRRDPSLITVMGKLSLSNESYATLLHQATLKDNLEMVQFLVSEGADINSFVYVR